jgi:hypothetical protein
MGVSALRRSQAGASSLPVPLCLWRRDVYLFGALLLFVLFDPVVDVHLHSYPRRHLEYRSLRPLCLPSLLLSFAVRIPFSSSARFKALIAAKGFDSAFLAIRLYRSTLSGIGSFFRSNLPSRK